MDNRIDPHRKIAMTSTEKTLIGMKVTMLILFFMSFTHFEFFFYVCFNNQLYGESENNFLW